MNLTSFTTKPYGSHQSWLPLIFIALFVVGAILRIVDIWQPIDQPSWREADVAGIARNFEREGMNLFYPRIDWRGDGPGYAEMEFPLYPWSLAALYKVFGYHEVIGRMVSYALSLITLGVYFKLAAYLLPPVAAVAASAFFVLSPLMINISTSFQPDGLMMLCYLVAAYSFIRWMHHDSRKDYFIAMFVTALAILAKAPMALLGIFFLLFLVSQRGVRALLQSRMWLFGVVALMPAVLWYAHARNFWLTYGNSLGVSNRTHGAGWQLFTDPTYVQGILSAEIFHVAMPAGVVLLGLGLWLRRPEQGVKVGLYWLAAVWTYYLVAARTTSDEWAVYYHIVSVPPVGLLLGEGVEALRKITFRPSLTAAFAAIPAIALMLLVPEASKFHVLSVLAGLGIVGLTLAGSTYSTWWREGLNDKIIGSRMPLVSTVVVYFGMTVFVSTLISETRMVYEKLSSDRRTQLYRSAETFKTAAAEPGLIGASGGPCLDRIGSPAAHNASYMFYWMDRKGFNICLEEQSIPAIMELAHKGARYYVLEKSILRSKPGLDAELRNTFPVTHESDVAILFDLSPVRTVSYGARR